MAWDGKVAGEDRSVSHCGECIKMETGVIGSTNDLTIPSVEVLNLESHRCPSFELPISSQNAHINSIHLATDRKERGGCS